MSEKKLKNLQVTDITPEAAAQTIMFDASGKLSPEQIAELDPNLADYAANIIAIQEQIATLEAGMTPEELTLVEQVVTAGDLSEATINRKTDRAPRPNILRSFLLLLVTLSILLAACSPVSGTETPATGVPTVVAVETIDTDPTASIESTATAFADLDIDYGNFTGFEPIVDPVLEDAWQEIIDSGVASPLGIDVIDVSSTNILVKVKPGNGYDNDTYFTISNIPGHEGEVLTVSLAGVNRVAGGTAVRLAIGINGLPVGLDIDNNVVGYIDETGQWVAGSLELAPSLPGTPAEPEPTPAEVDYFDMTPEERLEQSLALVERANNFSGEVGVPVEINGQTYMFFWNPTAVDKYDTGLTGAWKVEGSSDSLDRTGETLPPLVIAGYEHEDGSLVVVDPVTGQETVYANPNIPALGGVISYRDLYNIPQSRLAPIITDEALRDPSFGDNSGIVENITALQSQSFYLPVILYGPQTSVFAQGFDNGGGAGQDIPEGKYSAIEMPTNNGLVPIYSPETGDFMFFINIMVGNPLGQYNVFYSPDGNTNSRSVTSVNNLAFGKNGQDQFGIIVLSSSRISHYLGGGGVFIENSPVAGEFDVIKAIIMAKLETELFRILNDHRLLVAYPSLVYRPTR